MVVTRRGAERVRGGEGGEEEEPGGRAGTISPLAWVLGLAGPPAVTPSCRSLLLLLLLLQTLHQAQPLRWRHPLDVAAQLGHTLLKASALHGEQRSLRPLLEVQKGDRRFHPAVWGEGESWEEEKDQK